MFAKRSKRIMAGAVLLLAAFALHGLASEKTRQGITPPSRGDLPGHEDEFFGEDPREFALRPENQALLAHARRLDELALIVAGASVLILLSSLLVEKRGTLVRVASPAAPRMSFNNRPAPIKQLQLPAPTVGQAAARS